MNTFNTCVEPVPKLPPAVVLLLAVAKILLPVVVETSALLISLSVFQALIPWTPSVKTIENVVLAFPVEPVKITAPNPVVWDPQEKLVKPKPRGTTIFKHENIH